VEDRASAVAPVEGVVAVTTQRGAWIARH
jgi:hypothetical protein